VESVAIIYLNQKVAPVHSVNIGTLFVICGTRENDVL